MFRFMLVYALIAVAVGSLKIRPRVSMLDGRIVGGKDTNIEARPYQLSLQFFGLHICGAAIISTTRALTAAHCTFGKPPERLSVRSSSSFREQGGNVTPVESVCQHPKYDPLTFDNDVSVLRLTAEIPLGPGAATSNLAREGDDIPAGQYGTVSGWGFTSPEGNLAHRLQEVDVPRVNDAVCKSAYGINAITDRMICFGFDVGGKDACNGDSGSPIVVSGDDGTIQVGIVSWGYVCAQPHYPGVYAKVSALRGYIDSC